MPIVPIICALIFAHIVVRGGVIVHVLIMTADEQVAVYRVEDRAPRQHATSRKLRDCREKIALSTR